jgi:DNA-binding response OmpR family regulator
VSRVLVVDDDELVRELVVSKLSADGHDVASARDGEDGLAAALTDPPDLVVLDSMMPKMSGPEVCRRLRDEPTTRRTRVIMLTARRQEADVVQGFAVGADDYLVKPFSPSELVSRVRALLGAAPSGGGPATGAPAKPAATADLVADAPVTSAPGADPASDDQVDDDLVAAGRDVQHALRALDAAIDRLVARMERRPPT